MPTCATTIVTPTVTGGGNADVQVDLAKEVRLRDICLQEIAQWYAAERDARTSGAPGA